MDANICDMLIGLQWDTVIIGIQWILMFVIANKPTVGYCYFCNIGKKRDTVIIGK